MSSDTSNKKDPKAVEYYQTMADIIGIFWQFHKDRLQSGNLAYAYMIDWEKGGMTQKPLDLQEKIDTLSAFTDVGPEKIIDDFASDVRRTIQGSWLQFLEGMGIPVDHYLFDLSAFSIPESAQRFMDPYVRSLIDKAEELGPEASAATFLETFSVRAVVYAGLGTGSNFSIQLKGIFGDEFHPNSTVVVSKIRLDNVTPAGEEIGMLTTAELENGEEPNYSLTDNSVHGLDRTRLKELGLGDTIGCPAAMKVSKRTRDFLADRGVIVKTTMLEDFATMSGEKFNQYVETWYAGLTETQREKFVDSRTRRLLDGTVRGGIEGRIGGSCPYPSGKERRG